ncbi:hypothetical protein, variant [Aphanomyces invadans]|uniref:Arp2/3 complex 41 kDa subunit n=1 Tax=Aphanomyces invadans TaxID=157072 RepID=A0A024TY09_9STRA|nr:hypothetical protein, variant [Aphanomyces invadans]ETV98511.1 hypothetical protein, variant [Aphanomyces invadans]|eukprot:XP_008872708.1 hypothetical protein, variant [Aphanomyces invadans]
MSVFNLTDSITCHAWNQDRSKVAICPNTNEIWIYSNCHAPDASQWRKEAVLTEHDMVVSGLDWSPVHDMLVSCSHDRSAFVWKYEPSERKWKPSLVVLRITRAAMTVKWSPDGKKFAVGSSAKCVSVCYYVQADNWWISKVIKKHKSTVVDVDWHPNSQLLLTASTDMQCRVFAAYISDVDGSPDAGPFAAMAPFGEVMAEFDNANAWVNAAVWSPSGTRLAFAGHGSSIHFVQFGRPGEAPKLQVECSSACGLSVCRQCLSLSVLCFLNAYGFAGMPSLDECICFGPHGHLDVETLHGGVVSSVFG